MVDPSPARSQSMGHEKVSILDGGIARWMHEGYEVDNTDLSSGSQEGEVLSAGDVQVSVCRGGPSR